MLKGFYDKILEGNFDVLYCAYVFEESNEKEITNNMKDLNYGEVSGKEAALGLIYGTTYTHIMANLFKRSLLINNNIRFDEKRKFAEDISFMVKAYASSERVYCINKIYAHYVKWGESAMNNINLNYKDVYYSNVETLQYIKEKFNDKALEKAMVTSRIPAAIVNIFIGFATKKELHDDMYEFINDEKVRKDLRRYKMYKLEKDRLKYLILSKVILLKPSIIENYYGKRS